MVSDIISVSPVTIMKVMAKMIAAPITGDGTSEIDAATTGKHEATM